MRDHARNTQASGRQEYKYDVDATIQISTRMRDAIPLRTPNFLEEQVQYARSMILADVTNMRCYFCLVLGHSMYKCPFSR